MGVLQWTMLPALLIMAVRGFLTVMERTQVVLWATIAGALVNAALDYLLIFGEFGFPRLELIGAGDRVGFQLRRPHSCSCSFMRAASKAAAVCTFFGRIWRSDWPVFFQILRLGTPIAMTIMAGRLAVHRHLR
jgi:MATE family multidrug resistance protein